MCCGWCCGVLWCYVCGVLVGWLAGWLTGFAVCACVYIMWCVSLLYHAECVFLSIYSSVYIAFACERSVLFCSDMMTDPHTVPAGRSIDNR